MKHGDLSNNIEENIVVHLDSILQLNDLNFWDSVKLKFSKKTREEAIRKVDIFLYNYVHRLINKSNFAVTLVTTKEPIYKYMQSQTALLLPCGVCHVRNLDELKQLFIFKHVSFFLTDDETLLNCGLPQAIAFEEFSQISGVK